VISEEGRPEGSFSADMAASKAATAALDWARVTTKLGLGKETINALQAFRGRHDAALRVNAQLKESKATVDFEHYKSVLKNQEIVTQLQKQLTDYKPTDYDVTVQLKAIDAFEAKAVSAAEQTEKHIAEELSKLEATLQDIEGARPFEQLSQDEVAQAEPKIDETLETMLKKGRWTVPEYKEKFVNLNML